MVIYMSVHLTCFFFFVFVSGKEVLMTLKMSYCDVLDIGTESVKWNSIF